MRPEGCVRGTYRFRGPRKTAFVLSLAFAAQVLVACGGGSSAAEDPETSNMPVEDPSEFYGSTRTISGEVGEVYGPASFLLVREADDVSGRDPEGLLVVNTTRRAPSTEPAVGQVVTVTGRVEGFSLEEAQRETGVDLNDEALEGRLDEPSVFATMVDADDPARGTTTQGGTTLGE